jgi:hypothetical protein
MADDFKSQGASAAMRQINDAWMNGRLDELGTLVHSDVVMVVPGFSARIPGREAFLAGFKDFCDNAKIHEFRERSGTRSRSTGRDLWVLERHGDAWLAVWRAMLDTEDTAV